MKNILSKSAITVSLLAVLALSVAAPANAHNVNKSVKIGAGDTSSGESSVNGSISVGPGAIVTGDLSTVNGRIRVDSDATVEDVSTVNGGLRIDSGTTVGIIGTVGSGKSILVNLLSGVLRPERGMVFVNGVDIRDVDPESLYRCVALVP